MTILDPKQWSFGKSTSLTRKLCDLGIKALLAFLDGSPLSSCSFILSSILSYKIRNSKDFENAAVHVGILG